MTKRIISAAVALVLCFVMILSVNAIDQNPGIMPLYNFVVSCGTDFMNVGSDIYYNCYAYGYPDQVTMILGHMILQKKGFLGIWSDQGSWDSATSGSTYENSVKGETLEPGTYRLKTNFTVYAMKEYEHITCYSSELVIPKSGS